MAFFNLNGSTILNAKGSQPSVLPHGGKDGFSSRLAPRQWTALTVPPNSAGA